MQYQFPPKLDHNNSFAGCFFIQYKEQPFCVPGKCEEHTYLPKPVDRFDSKQYRNMYFFGSKASKSGIFKKAEATHWAIVDQQTDRILISDKIIHDNQTKQFQYKSFPLVWEDQTWFFTISFTGSFINYKISPHESFVKSLMASASS
jgi:hypothetical protein